MSTEPGLTAPVRAAVALVCGVDAGELTAETTLDSLGADSLARVSIADVVEADLVAGGIVGSAGNAVRIDDATLAKFQTLGEIDAYIANA